MLSQGAAGGVEKAHSRHTPGSGRWCLSVVETCEPGDLGTRARPHTIAMAHAFAELGHGTVVKYTEYTHHSRKVNGFKCGHILSDALTTDPGTF